MSDEETIEYFVHNMTTERDLGKVYNWVLRGVSAPESIWIPVTGQESRGHHKEAYELTEIYRKAVTKRFHYHKIKHLADPLIEKAAKEASHRSSELIDGVEKYLLKFLDRVDRRDDSEDVYRVFRKGLKKLIRSYRMESTRFIKTTQDTSMLSKKTPQEPTFRISRTYHPTKGGAEDYASYWKEAPDRYRQFNNFSF